jgi:hypothetical protein
LALGVKALVFEHEGIAGFAPIIEGEREAANFVL